MLVEVAGRIREALAHHGGEGALAARFGGDEFVILLQQGDVRLSAERLCAWLLADIHYPVGGATGPAAPMLGASIGIALFPDHAVDAAGLLHHSDLAMYEAKLAGKSVAKLIGSPAPGPIATALTVVIDTPEAMARAASAVADAPLIKVKVDSTDPATAIRAVRVAAPEPALIVDPNESWDEALVRAAMPVLEECRVSVLEQPCPAEADDWLADYHSPVPICADESLHTVAELDAVAARYGAVNIKLDKTGGLTAALELASAARERGLRLMSGCMVCTSLGIAPSLHIARLADWADLDGPLWLAEDRRGGVREERGVTYPPTEGFWG